MITTLDEKLNVPQWITIIDDTDSDNVYVWISAIWAQTSDELWQIKKIVKSWSITTILFPKKDWKTNSYPIFSWDLRSTYTYSL